MEHLTVILVMLAALCVGTNQHLPTATTSKRQDAGFPAAADESSQPQQDGPFSAVAQYVEEFGCTRPVYNRTSLTHDCLRRVLHFFRKYLARLDKGKQYDVCRKFDDVQECIEPLLDTCESFRERYLPILKPIIAFFRCACEEGGVCMENLHCFEVEYRGILLRRCDDYYKFNIHQKTHSQCYFLQEAVTCKTALVSTACDATTGHFAFQVFYFLAKHNFKTSKCPLQYTRPQNYNGFYYDGNCPTYFLQDLATCSTNHLWKQMLHFDEENDLIASGSEKDVRTACNSFKSYRRCIRHPRKACKKGTQEVFNYGATLRKYTLKMNFICKTNRRKEYMDSLRCYQSILKNESLQQCDYIYKDLKPWLSSVSAFQFYCREDSDDTHNMMIQLSRLQNCYEEVFTKRCGDNAGSLMGELILLAFQDPEYLRYSFRPDCKLHRKSSRLKQDNSATWDTTSCLPATPHTSSASSAVSRCYENTRRSWTFTAFLTAFMASINGNILVEGPS